jgi:glutathione S-transferase
MALTLIGSYTSPYVRKLRLLLHGDKNITFKAINYLEEEGNKYLKSISPFNQIPMLLDGDQPIYDSRIIFNYIAKKKNLKPLTVDEENTLSAIDTIIATGVNIFSLKKGGIDTDDSSNYFLVRQKERIPSLLKMITPWAAAQGPENNWNYLTMSMLSLLYWMKFRNIYDYSNEPELIGFLERFKNCPGVAETDPANT